MAGMMPERKFSRKRGAPHRSRPPASRRRSQPGAALWWNGLLLGGLLLWALLPVSCTSVGDTPEREPGGGGNTAEEVREQGAGLGAAFERVLAARGDARASGELALARRVVDQSAETAALYEDETRPEAQALWVRLMGLSGQRGFLPLIHRVLEEAPRHPVAGAGALEAMLLLSDPASAPLLRPLLRGDDVQGAVAALRYFKAHPDLLRRKDLAPLFSRSDPSLRLNLLDLLPHFIDGETFALCREALTDPAPALRVRGARCLGRMGAARPEQGAAVLEALTAAYAETGSSGADEGVRLEIIAAAGRGGGAGRGAWLAARMEGPSLREALAALVALQRQNLPETVPRLMALIELGRGPLPPDVLIKSLGLYRDVRTVPFLGARLAARDTPRAERLALLGALGDTGLLESQAHLAPYLSDYDPEIREAARQALQRIAGRQLGQGAGGIQSPTR